MPRWPCRRCSAGLECASAPCRSRCLSPNGRFPKEKHSHPIPHQPMSQDRTLVRPCDSLPGEGGLTLHRPAALVTNESPSLPVEGSRPVATRTTEVTPDGSDRESRAGTAAEGLRSTFAPPDAEPHGTGGNRRGPQVTAEAVGKLFVHVAGGNRDQKGMGGTGGEPLLRPVKSPALPTQVRILSLPQPL